MHGPTEFFNALPHSRKSNARVGTGALEPLENAGRQTAAVISHTQFDIAGRAAQANLD